MVFWVSTWRFGFTKPCQGLVNHEAQQSSQPDHRNLTGTQRQDYEMFFLTEINSSLWTPFFFCGADLWLFCELMDAGTQPKWTWQDQEQQTSDQLYVMFKHEQILCCPVSAVFFTALELFLFTDLRSVVFVGASRDQTYSFLHKADGLSLWAAAQSAHL